MASSHFLNALLLLQLSVVLANIPIPPSPAPLPSHDHLSPSPSPIDPPPPSHPPVQSPPPSSPPVESPPPPSPPPSHPPVQSPPPPSQPPVGSPPPPSQPPVGSPPPSYPYYPRFKVAVQGVVYCKSCKYVRVETLMEAAPLPGAVVKLRCGYIMETAKTDENGYFFFMPPNLKQYNVYKCKVSLVSSPLRRTCGVRTNLHDGASGASLVSFSKTYEPWPLMLFSVGPFAFEPPRKCRHY